MLRITMVSPALPPEATGNAITAARWAARLRELGHRVAIVRHYAGASCDLLVALHARKSATAALLFKRLFPDRPLVVVLTGTDLYRDLARSGRARHILDLATRIVLLQPRGLRELDPVVRRKTRVILQSAVPVRPGRAPSARGFDVAVLAHLRHVKDPLRAAFAARRLPPGSRIRIQHAGRALAPEFERRARREMKINPRYRWYGDLQYAAAQRLLGRSRALVLSSRLEGGANVVSEAAVAHVPVLASRIPGSVGLLGDNYPAYFEVGDTAGLAALLARVESDPAFVADLRRRMRALAPHFRPSRERAAWSHLLREIAPGLQWRGRGRKGAG